MSLMANGTAAESNMARMRRSAARQPRVPRVTKTIGLSDYLERKSRLRDKQNKWQWLIALGMMALVPLSVTAVQKQWFTRVSGSQGEMLTAVLTPYDVEMVDQTTFEVLVHLPLEKVNFARAKGEYLLDFDSRYLQIVNSPTELANGVTVEDIKEANATGVLIFHLDFGMENLPMNRIAKITFAPKVRIEAVTKITFAPESKIVLDDNKTYLVKGNSATVKILDGYEN